MVHELKTVQPYFYEVYMGRKTFEVRKNDRGFKVGDSLVLKEFKEGRFTGQEIYKRIIYMLEGEEAYKYGLADGYCVLGIK